MSKPRNHIKGGISPINVTFTLLTTGFSRHLRTTVKHVQTGLPFNEKWIRRFFTIQRESNLTLISKATPVPLSEKQSRLHRMVVWRHQRPKCKHFQGLPSSLLPVWLHVCTVHYSTDMKLLVTPHRKKNTALNLQKLLTSWLLLTTVLIPHLNFCDFNLGKC